jgi:prepilin-type N-terminal cleavage/methylation domain-containing protein
VRRAIKPPRGLVDIDPVLAFVAGQKEDMMGTRRGFTLVELLLVVLVLGALATIAAPRLICAATDARISACKTNVDLINSQLQSYYADHGAWPGTLSALTTDPNRFPDGVPTCPFGTPYLYNTTIHRVPDHIH